MLCSSKVKVNESFILPQHLVFVVRPKDFVHNPLGCMMVNNPTITYGCTKGDIATALARDFRTAPLSLNISSPQGCVLSPLLYTLYTHDCVSTHPDNIIVKFADDTTLVGLISGGDETAYREGVQRLAKNNTNNNLVLNTSKTKEMIVDYRRRKTDLQPICINGESVERVHSFKFLDLRWSSNTSAVVKKAQQRLHFLRILRRINLKRELLTIFYRCSIESVLTYFLCVWFSSCTMAHRKALQRVINMAQKIIGHPLPSLPTRSHPNSGVTNRRYITSWDENGLPLQDLYSTRCLRKARSILKDSSYPGHRVFQLLPLTFQDAENTDKQT
ncbi:hypothetical protein N1851_003511 [Merluccius polli]|uniref:Reverse transcriptase domain-containing protein n=1 Tax=Merluccius polli TaxID=89951 RepID=A0AA47PCE1_MERPO|nr:hypothetical protein N1851_003511 [Merluccius polli]